MASAFGKLPYVQRLEQKNFQPYYHDIDTCGSTFHGLATTLEQFATENKVAEGLEQINRCLQARRAERDKRANPDPAHNRIIVMLEHFYRQYLKLGAYNSRALQSTIVRFRDGDPGYFTITCAENNIRGGTRRRKNTRRKRRSTRKTA